MENWQPLATTTLIGSMPHKDREKVIALILRTIPDVPAWPQLSSFPPEQMMIQYLEGLPGIREEQGRLFVQTDASEFEQELVEFYEAYLAIEEGLKELDGSRFAMGAETGRTFFQFLDTMKQASPSFRALKGQIVGPFTLLTTLKDRQDRALIYNEQLLDVVVKHLALKAQWQIHRLRSFGRPVILFLDEPALAGFGSSAFIAISEELVQRLLREVVGAVHQAGALAGTHICANTDWDLVFKTGVDIINFDAYNYFEKFALYRDSFLEFINQGHIVAWGMVPTNDPDTIIRETSQHLADLWLERIDQLTTPAFSRSLILSQSLFSPSCGCGSLSEMAAERVLQLTSELGHIMRSYL
jgi:methionine synthase II (cobalamin-independent)